MAPLLCSSPCPTARAAGLEPLPTTTGLTGEPETAAPIDRTAAHPQPSPYDRVVAATEWTSMEGRRLSFCLLGNRHEDRARTMAVFEWTGDSWRRLFVDDDRGFSPWKLMLAELDGDDLPEIIVGTHNVARFDPVPRNRLFVFDWTAQETLFAKWLGSRLCGPFDDFTLAKGDDGRDRLLSIEGRGREKPLVREYRWNGFGFTQEGGWTQRRGLDELTQDEEELLSAVGGLAAQGVNP